MRVTLRGKAFLRRQGKMFAGEYTLIAVGSKCYRHKFAKRLNWNNYERVW